MVTSHSACSLGIPAEAIPALTNHSDLVKFSSREDGVYQTVLRKIINTIKGQHVVVTRDTVEQMACDANGRHQVPKRQTSMFDQSMCPST